MPNEVQLLRIRGIAIAVNWSWLVVFALIAWTLAAGVFPSQVKGLSNGAYLAMGLVAALLYFACLLLHELGHAFQAQREGMQIEGITLWLFGGVARFKGMFPSAGAELRIAVAGPLVSLLLGAALTPVGAWVPLGRAVGGVVMWLGTMNLVLLVFNLMPALPLDGGRILRATLWRTRGDLDWATHVAASIGGAFGYALIAVGLVLLAFVNVFSGAWLAFLGWFLREASGAEVRYLATRQALAGLRVVNLMARSPVTVAASASLADLKRVAELHGSFATYPVLDGADVVGLVPLAELARVPRDEWELHAVRELMLPLSEVPLLDADTEAADALMRLSERNVNRGLVLEDGRLVGLVSITDLARALETSPPRRPGPTAPTGRWTSAR